MRTWLLVIAIVSMISCKQKASLSGNEAVTFEAFADVFTELELPFTVADTSLLKAADTTTISRSIFKDFVPDTILSKTYGNDTSYRINPIGKVKGNDNEHYFVVYTKAKQKAAIYLLVFKNQKFSAGMPLLDNSNKRKVQNTASIDKKLSIVINQEWNEGDELLYKRTIYAYNNMGVFTTVLTETNVSLGVTTDTVINPIDTFPKANKYSGDYAKGPKNFISIRDGATPEEYLFFVHFMNNDEDPCGGSLRGEMKMTSENAAVYSASGDPCVIDFTFTSNSVKVKEQGSCGNYRGITCFFNDTYTRKKGKKSLSKK